MPLTHLEQQLLDALKQLVRACEDAEDLDDIDDVQHEASRAKQAIRDAERKS